MKIWKATPTLEGYLPPLDYTTEKGDAEVMLVGGKKFELAEFPNLRGIFKTGVGTDNLPFAQAKERGILIALPSPATCKYIYEETAAFTCHLILSGLYAEAGNWEAWEKLDRPALCDRRLLVIGTGRIGQRVVDKMKAFLKVDTFDIAVNAPEELESSMRQTDAISLHLPLSPDTKSFLSTEKLGWLKDGALVVNTARGPVVDEDALYAELAKDRLRAAFDVYWQEPYSGRLTELPLTRFIRTPHIASTCREFLKGTAIDFLHFIEELKTSDSLYQ